MSFTKQTPTKPGAYWFSTGQYKDKQLVEIYESGSRLFAWRHKMGFVEREWHKWDGEWEGPLVPAEEAQADAAAMREALNAIPFPCPCCSYATLHAESCVIGSALATNAGRELLAELQRLRSNLAKAQAQCAELRSEVEKAWHEGFIDGDFGEARADDCWNQSRARKVANGEQP